jgi:hypothetical protein
MVLANHDFVNLIRIIVGVPQELSIEAREGRDLSVVRKRDKDFLEAVEVHRSLLRFLFADLSC